MSASNIALPESRLVTLRRGLRNGGFGRPTRLLEQKVEAPADGADRTAQELAIAKTVFDTLERAYPGHLWFVDCDFSRGGVAIAIPVLMGGNWVFFIRMADLDDRMVAMAGGEVLERYRLARGGMRPEQFVEAREKHSVLAGKAKRVPT
jgi:hypothetical protein